MERLECMSFILKHHFPHLDLDLDSLRRTCDFISTPNAPPKQHKTTSELRALPGNTQPSGSPIENEDCTIDLVNDTTVRTFYPTFIARGCAYHVPHHDADYSGEFSHWNFSMHVKRNVDELMARANVPVCRNSPFTSGFCLPVF
jgi:hypothetical protein